MRIFLAGATGVIGVRLLPLMLAEGHDVAGMTRTPQKLDGLRAAGVKPPGCGLFSVTTMLWNAVGPTLLTRCVIDFLE